MTKIVIGYWKIRGLLAPIQYLLEVAGLEYEIVYYEFKGEFYFSETGRVRSDDVWP